MTSDPIAIKILVETDVNLAVFLLDMVDEASLGFTELLEEKSEQLAQLKKSGNPRRNNFIAESPSNFAGLVGIQNAMGNQGDPT